MPGKSVAFRQAVTEEDFKRIARLNHAVFAAEIGQHAVRRDGVLVDKFHHKNVYFVAEAGGEIVGLVTAHWKPPYSVEDRCPGFYDLIPRGARIAEVRLLAVHRSCRKSTIATGLIVQVARFLEQQKMDFVVISGIVQQQRMYRRLGFQPLGPAVRSGNAEYIPMIVGREEFLLANKKILDRMQRRLP
jgi:predicted N-acetyltransferase YhbS